MADPFETLTQNAVLVAHETLPKVHRHAYPPLHTLLSATPSFPWGARWGEWVHARAPPRPACPVLALVVLLAPSSSVSPIFVSVCHERSAIV